MMAILANSNQVSAEMFDRQRRLLKETLESIELRKLALAHAIAAHSPCEDGNSGNPAMVLVAADAYLAFLQAGAA